MIFEHLKEYTVEPRCFEDSGEMEKKFEIAAFRNNRVGVKCFNNALRPRVRIPLKPRNPFFRAFSQLLKLRFTCDGHILISFVFPQFTSFHSVFHSFHGLMNSINWPASSVGVFIAQAGRALHR